MSHSLKPVSSFKIGHWDEVEKSMCQSRFAIDCLGRLSSEQLGDLRNGNHANASQELVKAAHNLQGCEWLG